MTTVVVVWLPRSLLSTVRIEVRSEESRKRCWTSKTAVVTLHLVPFDWMSNRKLVIDMRERTIALRLRHPYLGFGRWMHSLR